MTLSSFPPDPKRYNNWKEWADRLVYFMRDTSDVNKPVEPKPILLASQIASGRPTKAAQDGALMFLPTDKIPVFSADGNWIKLARQSLVDTAVLALNNQITTLAGNVASADAALGGQITALSGRVDKKPDVAANNIQIDYGNVNMAAASQAVNFNMPFGAVPFIVAFTTGAQGATAFNVPVISNRTATGFTASVRLAQTGGTISTPTTGSFNWIAIGVKP